MKSYASYNSATDSNFKYKTGRGDVWNLKCQIPFVTANRNDKLLNKFFF